MNAEETIREKDIPVSGNHDVFACGGHGTIFLSVLLSSNSVYVTHVVGRCTCERISCGEFTYNEQDSRRIHDLHVAVLMLPFYLLKSGEDVGMVVAKL
jgi:hypothetical protein